MKSLVTEAGLELLSYQLQMALSVTEKLDAKELVESLFAQYFN